MRSSLDLRAGEAVATRPADIDLDDLDVGELLVIWALRMRLSRGPEGPVAGFRLAFGLSGIESALARFEAVFDLLQRHCRCDIGMHAPGCRRVSRDELTVVGAIAAQQADAALHAHAMAARLVGADVAGRFLECAGDLAATMRDHGLAMPLRATACFGHGRPHRVHCAFFWIPHGKPRPSPGARRRPRPALHRSPTAPPWWCGAVGKAAEALADPHQLAVLGDRHLPHPGRHPAGSQA